MSRLISALVGQAVKAMKRSRRRMARPEELEARVMLSSTTGDDESFPSNDEHNHGNEFENYLPPTSFVFNPGGYLTSPQVGNPLTIGLEYLRSNASAFGLVANDLNGLALSDLYQSADTGMTHIYIDQILNGLEVINADININVSADGRVLTAGSSFLSGLSQAAYGSSLSPGLDATQAYGALASQLGIALTGTPAIIQSVGGSSQQVLLSAAGGSRENVSAELVYVPTPTGVELSWNLIVQTVDGDHWYSATVSAADGALLDVADWMSDATYNVYAANKESPSDGPRTVETDPQDPNASPFGWHDTNGVAGAEFTITRGNNVNAYADRNDDNAADAGSQPDGGAGLDFNFPIDLTQAPSTYNNAAVTNLFYWNNIIHDWHYQYGFDEASGNFQANNYGNGGAGNDAVNAEAQDGADTGKVNNANFGTPPDGLAPRMQMFEWTTASPRRDGDLDAGVILHEYGHGVSNRLTGGPANASALNALQSGSMGEGWSDIHALLFTQVASDSALVGRGIGTYVLNQAPTGAGIRSFRYTYDMSVNPLTYNDVRDNSRSVPHGVGEIWAATLWDLNWALIDGSSLDANIPTAGLGFDPDMLYGTGGNNLVMQLIMDGMKLQPANPSFLDARDAILAADVALTGGQYQGTIWQVFARRGMGYSANDGGTANTRNVTAAFDLPPFSAGTISLDKAAYRIGQTATITVVDSDLIGTGTLNISVSSTLGDVENVTLVEIFNGTFEGTISIVGGSPVTDGFLNVAPGDTITATYNDADDGSGPAVVTATATAKDQLQGGVWGVRPSTGEIVKINPQTGVVTGAFAAPGILTGTDTNISLSIARGGEELIYQNGSRSSTVYRLDSQTGAVLGTFTGSTLYAGMSFDTDTSSGTEYLFGAHRSADIHREIFPGAGSTLNWATGGPIALGGDDNGRQFGYFADGLIHEYDPFTDTNTFISSLTAPAGGIEGMAFDGTYLYVSTTTGLLYTLNPDTGAVLSSVTTAGGALYGLGALTGTSITGFSGIAWNDLNGNSLRDAGEPGLGGVTVYIDLDDNGMLNGADPFTTTASDGSYQFNGLAAGQYIVREIVPVGFELTFPRSFNGITNGDFETGDTTGWTEFDSSTDLNGWDMNNGTFDPPGSATPLAPLGGRWDVVSRQSGPGTRSLTQTFRVPAGIAAAQLSWLDRIQSFAPLGDPDQEFRVQFRTTSDVLIAEIYSTDAGDPAIQIGPNSRSFDVTALLKSLAGQTVKLVFEERDVLNFFNISLDDIRLDFGLNDGFWRVDLVDGQVVSTLDFGNAPLPKVLLSNQVTSLPEDTLTTPRIRVADFQVIKNGSPSVIVVLTGPNAGLFEISGAQLFLKSGVVLDFETQPVLQVSIEVDDPNRGPSPDDTATLTINILDVNEPPVVSNYTVTLPEDTAVSTVVQTITATDQDLPAQTFTFTIVGGNTGAVFGIDSMTGILTVASPLDFETKSSYTLFVEVRDSGSPAQLRTSQVTITVTDVNEKPNIANAAFSLNERAPVNTIVGSLNVTDPDAGTVLTYTILSGNTGGAFAVDANGNLVVANSTPLKFVINPVFTLDIMVEDNGTPVLSNSATITVNLNDINELPVVDPQTFFAIEHAPSGTIIGTATGSDADGTIMSWAIVGGNPGGAFSIDSMGVIRVNHSPAVNYETSPVFQLVIEATDDIGDTGTGIIEVALTDVDEQNVAVFDRRTRHWMIGDSNGAGFALVDGPSWFLNEDISNVQFVTGDFDGDGDIDVAGMTSTGVWLVGRMNGTQMSTEVWGVWPSTTWSHVTSGDFNGDGRADVIGQTPNGTWWIAESTGSQFNTRALGKLLGLQWVTHQFGDFNGDGKTDIASFTQQGFWWLTTNVSSGFSQFRSTRVAAQATVGWMNFLVGDFNGDGTDDITAQQNSGQWWKMLGGVSGFTLEYGNRWATNFFDFHVGDFNGDGKDDIVARTYGSNAWWVNQSTATGRFFARYAGSWTNTQSWTSVIGDFNGDGKDDIAGITAGAGTWYVQWTDGNLFQTVYFRQWLKNEAAISTEIAG